MTELDPATVAELAQTCRQQLLACITGSGAVDPFTAVLTKMLTGAYAAADYADDPGEAG